LELHWLQYLSRNWWHYQPTPQDLHCNQNYFHLHRQLKGMRVQLIKLNWSSSFQNPFGKTYSHDGLVMSMFSGYFSPVALYISTAAPTNPPTSKLPAMANDGNAGVETVKRSKY